MGRSYEINETTKEKLIGQCRREFISAAIEKIMIGGYVLEFGVGEGHSLRIIASGQDRLVHAFDSFEGLPENWELTPHVIFAKGSFKYDPPMVGNTTLIRGWFEDTLPSWKIQNSGPVAFMHIDSDLYSSCATILTELNDQILPGTIILFDELFLYHHWEQGEWKALQEWIADFNREVFQLETNGTQAFYRVIK